MQQCPIGLAAIHIYSVRALLADQEHQTHSVLLFAYDRQVEDAEGVLLDPLIKCEVVGSEINSVAQSLRMLESQDFRGESA